jgi:lipopolysaccharide exporter
MSLTQKAARGAAWTILFGLAARAIGVAGTLVMTHLIQPEVIGEVAVATVVVMMFNWISNWGFSQYVVVKGRGDATAEVTWHCTVAHVALGGAAMIVVGFVGGYMTPWFSAPAAAAYVPGMAVALGLRRLGAVPEKVLVRGMHFRAVGISLAVGETVYATVSVLLAWRGHGGMSVVWGNIAQSVAVVAVLVSASGVRSWLTPTPLRAARFRDMARFGLPLGVEAVAHNAARYCDKILVSRYFQPGPMALYNMGYNLADIPAVYVGEQIGQVLLPSFAQLPPERRPAALERATALLALLIFPMAIGLAAVADSLVAVALSPQWQGVAPLLTILSVLAIFRPITWTLGTYLEATEQTSKFMWLELGKVVVLFAGIAILQRWGIYAAASAVGVAFGANAVAGVWIVSTGVHPAPSPARLLSGFARPLMACAVMAAAVLGARHALRTAGVADPGVLLVVEIAVGVVVYVPAAFAFAGPFARDFVRVLRQLRRSGTTAA